MEKTVYNFAKDRLETIEIDFEDGLLITKHNFNYSVLIYDVTRKDIGNTINQAWRLKESYM